MTCCAPNCPKSVPAGARVPICDAHAMIAVSDMYARRETDRDVRQTQRDAVSVVYYVDFGDRIKIGYSAHLFERLSALRANPSQLLAYEPGARDLEQQRHHEFRSIRVTSRREDFWKREPLLTHIKHLQATHPQPRRLPDTRPVTVRTT